MASEPTDRARCRVRDLGPMAIDAESETVLRGKAGLALALFVSKFPHRVSRQNLFDVLWGADAPGDHANGLRVLVHRLRQVLGSPDYLVHEDHSYRLVIARSQFDSVIFEQLIEEANNQLGDAQPQAALATLDQALALWRGPTAGGEPDPALHGWQVRLETKRFDAEEDRIQALLDSGEAELAAADARILVEAQPYRERRWELLMLALYRCGRQSESLGAASEATLRLSDELGIAPRSSLRQLELDILQQASHLDHEPSRANELPLLPAMAEWGMLGRANDVAHVSALLNERQVVTVAGPGGIGKTTVALGIARDQKSSGEVWWCDLSLTRARSADAVVDREHSEVALRVGVAAGVRNGTDRPAEVAKILSHRDDVLLVLDNCDHVLDDARFLIETLRGAANVSVLATSRRPLNVTSEALVRLGPLDVESAAVELFERVARSVAPTAALEDKARVSEICDRLDGMPLAIELVARRTRTFSIREIDQHLEVLLHDDGSSADRSDRHATMTSALAWSTELLSPQAQRALGIAAVFPGSFDLEAFAALVADEVAGPPLLVLEELVDHGLMQVLRTTNTSRYRLLQPIRHHAVHHLAVDATRDRDRHLDHYLERLEAAYVAQRSSSSEPLSDLIRNDLENFAAIHEWALASKRFVDDMRLYRPLNIAHLYDRPEPFLWARETVEVAPADTPRFGDALHAAWYGALAVQLDLEAAAVLVDQFRDGETGDSADLAELARGLHQLLVHHDYDGAEAHFLGASQADPYVRYVATSVGALVPLTRAYRQGTAIDQAVVGAGRSITESLAWARSIGAKNFEAGLLEQQAQVVIADGDLDGASELATAAQRLAAARGMGHVQAQAQFQLVRCEVLQGHASPDVAWRMADVLDRTLRASARARLRWQLPLAAQFLAANGHNDVASLCLSVGGFAPESEPLAAKLSTDDRARGAELAHGRNLLDVAALVVLLLRDPLEQADLAVNSHIIPLS